MLLEEPVRTQPIETANDQQDDQEYDDERVTVCCTCIRGVGRIGKSAGHMSSLLWTVIVTAYELKKRNG